MEGKKSKIKTRLVQLGVVLTIVSVSIIAGLYLQTGGTPSDGDIFYSTGKHNGTVPIEDFFKGNISIPVEDWALNPTWNPITQDYRPRWQGCTDEEYKQIFNELPKFPQDFYTKYLLFMRGELNDYERLGPEYWNQPEWYDLNQVKFSRYIEGWGTHWNIGQVGCKPMVRMIEVKKGVTLNLSTYFHADITGSQCYLGGVLYASLPEVARDLYGSIVFYQPSGAESYIKTRILSPEHDPLFLSVDFQSELESLYTGVEPGQKIVLFPATRRVALDQGKKILLGYPENFVYKVNFEVSIDKNCPSGKYVVSIDLKNNARSVVEEYKWRISGYPHYSFYYDAIREYHPACPYFQLVMEVL